MTPSAPGSRRGLVAIVPIRGLELAKSRLGEVLDAEERRDLVEGLLRRVVRAARMAPGVGDVIVVTPDRAAADAARRDGARVVVQSGGGLNEGLEAARGAAIDAGATAILVLPADLPDVSPSAVEAIIRAAGPPPVVAIVSDLAGEGTNALLLAPPDVVRFRFGPGSRRAHASAAIEAGARLVELEGPLARDLDTADDLLREEALARTDEPAP
jgi:2-phospho-L-lactate guanylyltransferase